MKILVLSDLHIEFEPFEVDYSAADVVILAGDIHVKSNGYKWVSENIKDVPVIYILGNHEYYGKAYPKLVDDLKGRANHGNIHILEKDTVTIDGVNFLGCTLWTDFELFGDARLAGYQCQQVMNDFRHIRISPRFSKLRSIDAASIHRQSLIWLGNELEKRQGETNIVVTHHAPSRRSLPGPFQENIVGAAYASDLEHVIARSNPHYWIHGHTHNSSDYVIGKTRVLSNPKGYPDERNPDFRENFMIEIESGPDGR